MYQNYTQNSNVKFKLFFSGDFKTIDKLATHTLRSTSESQARTVKILRDKKFDWRIVRVNEPPKVVSVRTTNVMPMLPEKYEKRICQVVVKFNTDQVSQSSL